MKISFSPKNDLHTLHIYTHPGVLRPTESRTGAEYGGLAEFHLNFSGDAGLLLAMQYLAILSDLI